MGKQATIGRKLCGCIVACSFADTIPSEYITEGYVLEQVSVEKARELINLPTSLQPCEHGTHLEQLVKRIGDLEDLIRSFPGPRSPSHELIVWDSKASQLVK